MRTVIEEDMDGPKMSIARSILATVAGNQGEYLGTMTFVCMLNCESEVSCFYAILVMGWYLRNKRMKCALVHYFQRKC